MQDQTLSDAMKAYVGQAAKLDDVSPEQRVATQIGEDAALDLLPRVRAILDAMYCADPPLQNVATVGELGERASEWLRANYPDLSPGAVRAGANRFSIDWR
jgi:hypothetical protein